MIRTIVLAHGEQARFTGMLDRPKQLIDLGGESIIARTVRLFRGHVDEVVVIAPWGGTVGPARVEAIPYPGGTTLHGLHQTRHLWNDIDRLIVLLGDVVFSTHTRDVVMAARSLTFVGREGPNPLTGKPWGELFALVCPRAAIAQLDAVLHEPHWQTAPGRLRDLAQFLRGCAVCPFAMTDIVNDYTDDIDTPEDVEAVLPRLRTQARDDIGEPLTGVLR